MRVVSIFGILLILAALLLVFITIGAASARKFSWSRLGLGIGMSIALMFCILFAFLSLAYVARVKTTQHAVVSSTITSQIREDHYSQQAELNKRIQKLERQLEADLIPINPEETSTKKITDNTETQLAADVPKTGKTEEVVEHETKQNSEQLEQQLVTARKDLKKEQKRFPSTPQWLKQNQVIDKKNLDSFLRQPETIPNQFVVSSGQYSNAKEAREEAELVAMHVVAAKANRQTVQKPILADKQLLDTLIAATLIENFDVNTHAESTEVMYRAHLLIEFNQSSPQALLPQLLNSILDSRIITVATSLIGIMLTGGLINIVLPRSKE